MKLRLFLTLVLTAAALCLGTALASVASPAPAVLPESGVPVEQSASATAGGYLLKEYNGRLAVLRVGEDVPEMIFNVYTRTLPEADRAMLAAGIEVNSYEELVRLIDDYVS